MGPVSDRVDFGVHSIEVEVGDHLCGLYAGTPQRDEILIPYLAAGLRAGDKCICVVDGTDPTEIVAALAPAAAKQLDVVRAADLYLRSGTFSAPEIIGSWKAAIGEAMYEAPFPLVRAVETWSARDVVPDMDELLLLESEMNRYLPLYPQVIVCLYDIERFGGRLIVDLLKTHRRVLMGETVMENPFCLTPDELLALTAGEGHDANERDRQEMAEWCFAATTGST